MNLNQDLELQWLHKVNKHQLSDLIFIDDEVRFLKSLLDKYFLTMIQATQVNRIQLIDRQLSQLVMIKANITKDVLTHQGNLHSKSCELLDKSIDFLKLENDRIEDEIKDLHKCFRNIKKEIFTIAKHISSGELVDDSVLG